MTFKPRAPGKPRAAGNEVPAGLKYRGDAHCTDSQMPASWKRSWGSGVTAAASFPSSQPLAQMQKKCSEAKLSPFSVLVISPLGPKTGHNLDCRRVERAQKGHPSHGGARAGAGITHNTESSQHRVAATTAPALSQEGTGDGCVPSCTSTGH